MKIYEFIVGMSNLSRWSQAHCHSNESVLEHTSVVSFYSLKLAIKHQADIGEVLQKALVHDMEETIVGDIPTPTKYANENLNLEIKAFEKQAALNVTLEVFNSDIPYDAWDNAKDDTLSGEIVRIADTFAVVYKIAKEVETGNKYFLKYKENTKIALEDHLHEVCSLLKPDVRELINFLEEIK